MMKKYEKMNVQCYVKRPIEMTFQNNVPRLLYICKNSPEFNGKYARVMHSHDNQMEVVLVYSGKSRCLIDDRIYEVKKGDLMIYNQGIVHDEMAGLEMADEFGYYCIGLDNFHLADKEQNTLTNAEQGYLFHTGSDFRDLCQMYEMIFQNLTKNTPGVEAFCNAMTQCLMEKVITVTGAAKENALITQTSKDNTLVLSRRIKEYMDENYKEQLTISDIGKALFLSPYYVAHVFKDASGYSPIQYLLRRRIGEAQNLLLETDMPIAQIALEVGFDNQSYFSIQFTKNVGMPPLQFRKNYLVQLSDAM